MRMKTAALALCLGLFCACGGDGDADDSKECSACYQRCDEAKTSRMLECQLMPDSWTQLACESGAEKTWNSCVKSCEETSACK